MLFIWLLNNIDLSVNFRGCFISFYFGVLFVFVGTCFLFHLIYVLIYDTIVTGLCIFICLGESVDEYDFEDYKC